MAENSAQEKTEEATPKRKLDSRKKGQAPRSKELQTFTSLLAAGFAMLFFGKGIVNGLTTTLVGSLSFEREYAFSDTILSMQMSSAAQGFVTLLFPLFVTLFVASLMSSMALGGWIFSFSQVQPKFERLNPLKGLAKIFSIKSLIELPKSIGKFVLVAGVAIFVLNLALEDIYALSLQPIMSALSSAGALMIWCFFGFSSVLIVVVAIDVPVQLWEYRKQLKMTKQETKDESKETDGRPEVKSAIREKQQEFARQRMMAEVPTANVIITNPTHFAVALRYEQNGSFAPKVVAKGQDLVAARIREVGEEHGVVVFSAPPLARALYASTDLNQEIPANLFVAVAQVLAYVFHLQNAMSSNGKRPVAPDNIPIPAEYESAVKQGGLTP
ncbi:MAG: flagellar biosynthesis protein FlhB [Pseudohongiella sp.]|nr:MAG: flagellar biosynthesis protein FlhB [Pseudohongiella sp.]